MDSHSYKDVHEKTYNSINSNLYRVVHDTIYTNMKSHSHRVVHDKTYNNINITHNRVNQLITHHIHKQITKLNKLVNDEAHS